MVAKKENSRAIKAAETKQRIFDSAIELFKKDGLDASVDSIVEMAGVSKGAFYVHYESKASLILDYVNSIDLNYADYYSSLPSDTKPSKMLILVTEKIIDVIMNTIGIDLMKVIYTAQITKTTNLKPQLSYSRKLYQIYRQMLQLGVEQGEFRSTITIDSVSKHFVMSIRGMIFEWCIRYPDFDLNDEMVKHLDLLILGINNS